MIFLQIFAILIGLFKAGPGDLPASNSNVEEKYVRIIPEAYDGAFPNPMKGLRSSSLKDEEYPTLTRLYIKWNEIENSEDDGVDKILAYCDTRWKDLPARNIKVIPRIYLEWPYNTQNNVNSRDTVINEWGEKRFCERYWPGDMVRGDYSSSEFKKRLEALIEKLGKAWDNDPRVAYIEMGLIGWWGEQHSPSISREMQIFIGNKFATALKNKIIMARYARDFSDFQFGEYWDSFAHVNESDEAVLLMSMGDKWKYSVRGGELAYDWGDRDKTGKSPDQSLKTEEIRNYLIDNIRKLHWNHLGWINEYDPKDPEVRTGAAIIQKNLGYRFVIDEVSYNSEVSPGGNLKVIFTVRNEGSSPFYYNWPVEVSLLDPLTRLPVWKSAFKSADVRNWLPGDSWNTSLRRYNIDPLKIIVNEDFILPADLTKGKYILALSILDPAGNVPSLRFAIRNYFTGGRHPVGWIGVNLSVENPSLGTAEFDDLKKDKTLFYKFDQPDQDIIRNNQIFISICLKAGYFQRYCLK